MYPHILARLVNTPLMVLPAKLNAIMAGLGPRLVSAGNVKLNNLPDASQRELEAPRKDAARHGAELMPILASDSDKVVGNIAIIPVIGPLVHRFGDIDAESGITRSYESIQEDFDIALEAPEVGALLFDFETPGGEASANLELADYVWRKARQSDKPVWGLVNSYAFSAGYSLASAVENLIALPTAEVGSIGVIAMLMSQAKFDERLGVEFEAVYAGDRKNDYNPHEPIKKEAKDRLQESVDTLYEAFTELVARNREVSVQAVKDTQAATFGAQEAIDIGLIDNIMTYEEAIALLAHKISRQNKGDSNMKFFGKKNPPEMEEDFKAVLAQAQEKFSQEEIAETLESEGFVPAEEADEAIKTAFEEGVKEGEKKASQKMAQQVDEQVSQIKAEIVKVVELCVLGDVGPKEMLGFIEKGLNPDAVRKAILDAKAAHDMATAVMSTHSGVKDGESLLVRKAREAKEKFEKK